MKYRVLKDTFGYYPQVKIGWWIFSKWMRISINARDFGLYPWLDYPLKTEKEAEGVIDRYKAKKIIMRYQKIEVVSQHD